MSDIDESYDIVRIKPGVTFKGMAAYFNYVRLDRDGKKAVLCDDDKEIRVFKGHEYIRDIRFFKKLTNLNSLDLSDNNISDIKALLPLLEKGLEISLGRSDFQGKINLNDNPITNPPLEIVKQGREAVIRYFEKLEKEGKDYIYEAKLTLVGEGGSGKTSLQTRIIDKEQALPTSEERTRGIKISEWSFKGSEDKIYSVNMLKIIELCKYFLNYSFGVLMNGNLLNC